MLIRKATIDDIDFIISSNMSVNEVSNLNKKVD